MIISLQELGCQGQPAYRLTGSPGLCEPHRNPTSPRPGGDPHRNPTDETAHSGILVMRVKGTENSQSAASMRVSWAVGAFFQVGALGMTELLKRHPRGLGVKRRCQ